MGRDVDAIVVGSGPGGLAAAVGLARGGLRVLVLEQHYLPGGWSHSFTLDGFTFSPGVHYVGELGPGGGLRALYEGLGVSGDLEFLELNPDGYEHALIAGERFDWPATRPRLQQALIARFPHEADGIRRYLDLVVTLYREVGGLGGETDRRGALSRLAAMPTAARWAWVRYEQLLRRWFDDPVLRAVLSVQAGDHATPFARVPAAVQLAITGHYLDGGYYPRGGGRAIPKAFLKALRRRGGEIRVQAEVDRILVERGRALGVRLVDGTEIRAPIVVSNADPAVTWGRLVPVAHQPWRLRARMALTAHSCASLMLFFAVDDDVRARGLDSGNLWYSRTSDVDAAYRAAAGDTLGFTRQMPGFYLGCSTLKDPSHRRDGLHTFEAIAFAPARPFARWQHTSPADRPQGYVALKERLTERMLGAIDRAVPGLAGRVVFHALGTPVTNRHYLHSPGGAIYGTARRLRNLVPFGLTVTTPIDGLYQVGASTLCHGVYGATLSGVHCAQRVLHCTREELFRAPGPPLRVSSAEVEGLAGRAVA